MSKKPMNNERSCKACSSSEANTKNAENDTQTVVELKTKTTARYDRISELAKPKFISKMNHNKEIVCVRQPTKSLPSNKSVEQLTNSEASSNEVKTINSTKCVTGNKSSMSLKRPESICSQKTFVKTPLVNTVKAQLPSSSTVGCKIAWLNSQTNEQSSEASVNNVKSQLTSKENFSTVYVEHSLTQSVIRNISKNNSSDLDKSVATDAGDTQIIAPSVGVVSTKPAAGDRDSRLDSKISFSEYLSTNENIKKWQKIHTDIVTNKMNEQPEFFIQDSWFGLKTPTKLGRGNILADSKIFQQNPQKNCTENAADDAERFQGPYKSGEKKLVQPAKLSLDLKHHQIAGESRATSSTDNVTSTVEYPFRPDTGILKNHQDAKFILSAENIKILKQKFADIIGEKDDKKSKVMDSSIKLQRCSENQFFSNRKPEWKTVTTKHKDKEQQQLPRRIVNVLFDGSMWASIICCLILTLITLFYHPSDAYNLFK